MLEANVKWFCNDGALPGLSMHACVHPVAAAQQPARCRESYVTPAQQAASEQLLVEIPQQHKQSARNSS